MALKAKRTDATRGGARQVGISYDQDVVAWSVEQARLLRAGRFDLLDIEHIADEIEDVGKSEARDLASRMAVLLAHWLKWKCQPTHRSRSWENTIREQRLQVLRRLERTPSLRPELQKADFIEDVWGDALTIAARETGIDIASFPRAYAWPLANVLREDWTPDSEESKEVEVSG
jgi:Domain of unknown function DUF29